MDQLWGTRFKAAHTEICSRILDVMFIAKKPKTIRLREPCTLQSLQAFEKTRINGCFTAELYSYKLVMPHTFCLCNLLMRDFISRVELCVRSVATGRTKSHSSLMQSWEPQGGFKKNLVLLGEFFGGADLLEKRSCVCQGATFFRC